MQLSSYQQNIIDWVQNGTGHGCCSAVAGSGKSTTLFLVAKALHESGIAAGDVKVIVFGSENSKDLKAKFKKLGKQWEDCASTLNSTGWRLVLNHLGMRQGNLKDNKYKSIAQDLGLVRNRSNAGTLTLERAIKTDSDFTTLVDLIRLTNNPPEPEAVREIAHHFELDVYEYSITAAAAREVLASGEAEAKAKIRFDYNDQVWLPVKWGIKPRPFKFVLIDEAQDLNATQLELALSLAGDNGRILAVGDRRQAIMGFAGADHRSYDRIVERLNATELPLSTCYRCPRITIDLVRRNFPDIPIEPKPDAEPGTITTVTEQDLWNESKPSHLVEGDMVLCRKTAPLVNLCIRLIGKGIAATVKGKAIGQQIKAELEEIARVPGFTYPRFHESLKAYQEAKSQRYKGLDNEEQLREQLRDKLEALETIYKSQPNASSVYDLGTYIDSLFSNDKSPITLSTCHRAKGLEGDRVFIIKPGDMPMVWRNQQDWQLTQENNLLYVALTRAKRELYVVGDAEWLNPPEPEPEAETAIEEDESFTNWENFNPPEPPTEENPPELLTVPVVVDNPPELFTGDYKQFIIDNPLMSDRSIAAHCGVSANTVGKWRKRLTEAGLIDCNGVRVDARGRQLKTDRIGTKPKPIMSKILKLIQGIDQDELLEIIAELQRLSEF